MNSASKLLLTSIIFIVHDFQFFSHSPELNPTLLSPEAKQSKAIASHLLIVSMGETARVG